MTRVPAISLKSIARFLLLIVICAMRAVAATSHVDVSATITPSHISPGINADIAININVHNGYHAQSHQPLDPNFIPLNVSISASPNFTAGEPNYPPGEIRDFPALGKLSVYEGQVVVHVPIQMKGDASAGAGISGTVSLQACNDRSCFPPEKIKFEVAPLGDAIPTSQQASSNPSTTSPVTMAMNFTPIAPPSAHWSIPAAFGAALLAGLLFNIMPCVLPVLPLKAIGFYEAAQHSRARSFMLGIIFSLGLISVFAVLAMLVLVFRLVSWGGLFSQAWFIWTIVVVLIALGFGLLGGWNLSLPVGVYTFEPRHDTIGGNFFWGALTAILATPCTAPLLPPVLAWASLQPIYVGVPAMLMVGVGMSLPYLILSATPELARKFPRTGPWSELFKQMMGFLLLAAATFFATGRLIGGIQFWWAIVAVVAIAAVFLVARASQLGKSARSVGIASVLAVAMLGGSLWWTAKVTGLASRNSAVIENFEPYSDARFQSLRDSGKPLLVKFTANWCATCQVIEGTVFQDPQVWKALREKNITSLKVDLTESDAPGQSLLLQLNPTGGIPLTAIFFPGKNDPVQLASLYSSRELLEAIGAK